MGNEGEHAIIGHGHDDLVDMLGEGHAFHIGQYLLIVFEGFIQTVLLEFRDGEYPRVVHAVMVLVLGVEDGVELVMELGDLVHEAKFVRHGN